MTRGQPENDVRAQIEIQQLSLDPHGFHMVTKAMRLPWLPQQGSTAGSSHCPSSTGIADITSMPFLSAPFPYLQGNCLQEVFTERRKSQVWGVDFNTTKGWIWDINP